MDGVKLSSSLIFLQLLNLSEAKRPAIVVPLGGGNCAVSHREGWGHSLKKGFLGNVVICH